MINSFHIIGKDEGTKSYSVIEERKSEVESPLDILKLRFASGEITEDEYQRKKRILDLD